MKKLKILYRMLQLGKKPEDYRRIEKLRQALQQQGHVARAVEWFEKKHDKEIEDHDYFSDDTKAIKSASEGKVEFSPGSFGQLLKDHYKRNQIQLEYFDALCIEGTEKEKIYAERILVTHDCWHLLLGIQTDRTSEIQLQSLLYKQTYWPTAPLLIGGYILRVFLDTPKHLPEAVHRIFKIWSLGEKVPNLYYVKWAELMDKPLSEVREELNVSSLMSEDGFNQIPV